MFQAIRPLFVYCVTPVHMGAGTAVGLIDNPIQRERHTEYPVFAGSGLKGAVRHRCWAMLDEKERGRKENLLNRLFGPEAGGDTLHAGAVSFGDAQLVAFPVRCTKRAYVYATSPMALARVQRLLEMAGIETGWTLPEVQPGFCRVVEDKGPADNGEKLHLEAFEHTAIASAELRPIAEYIAEKALPEGSGYAYFSDKIKADLIVLPDEDFGYFVKHATVVEPHVRIDNDTGTAAKGGLFYTENLPPESLLLAPVMASAERSGKGGKSADEVLEILLDGGDGIDGIDGRLVQVGGDATTGRGQVVVKAAEG